MLWPRRVWWAPADLSAIEWPLRCATCGASLQQPSQPGTGPHERTLRVASAPSAAQPGYCSTCLADHARHGTRAQALGAAAVLGGVTTALALPLIAPTAPLALHLFVAAAVALAPLAGLGSRRGSGLWGSPPRVHGLGPLGTIIERRELAEQLALQGRASRAAWLPPIAYRTAWALIPALALGLAALAFDWHHPRLWVINLGRERLWLAVDGTLAAAIDPAGSDPSRAALELRLPRGERTLEAFDEHHRPVASVRAFLQGGRDHVYAPASADSCFWLESTGYGRDPTHDVRPLATGAGFFALDTDVDSWFAASPEPPAYDRRSSGGTLTALRQSPCSRAPESVRRAISAIGP